MRIDGFQNIPAILQSTKTEKSQNPVSGNETKPGASVSLSSFGEVLQSLQRQTVQTTQSREAKVDELQKQVKSPDFKIDHSALAKQLLDSNIINPGL
ncbi:MAG TPA: flagellar biosynthesis anti-sigma factor FlgM [bacterium]|nr:flagellar biosynthesis anti-sigma factor FlgM [bacterium]